MPKKAKNKKMKIAKTMKQETKKSNFTDKFKFFKNIINFFL